MKYDLAEIDRMRAAVRRIQNAEHTGGRWMYGSSGNTVNDLLHRLTSQQEHFERERRVEDQLRTYMANGTTPVDLEAYAKAVEEKIALEARLAAARRLLEKPTSPGTIGGGGGGM